MCASLNCEYLLVDAGWRSERWGWLKDGGDPWARLDELCRYAAQRNVDIFLWHAYPQGRKDGPGLTSRADRMDFLQRCRSAGVKGVKIDFFNSESKEVVDVYEDILRMTAEHRLMVNFHGANKPTGQTRTWPHEITREGIREQEYLLWGQLPLHHYAALPFTRMVAGHADFLPAYVQPKHLKNTTAAFQAATAVIFTSPFICWPDHPEAYLESPLLPLIRDMPAVWDRTLVLDGSGIGQFVAFARLSQGNWYAAVMNCKEAPVEYSLKLDFLGDGEYQAALYRDGDGGPGSLRVEAGRSVQRQQAITVELKAGGGFVGLFSKPHEYTK
jgi:alpha-glucosidase